MRMSGSALWSCGWPAPAAVAWAQTVGATTGPASRVSSETRVRKHALTQAQTLVTQTLATQTVVTQTVVIRLAQPCACPARWWVNVMADHGLGSELPRFRQGSVKATRTAKRLATPAT